MQFLIIINVNISFSCFYYNFKVNKSPNIDFITLNLLICFYFKNIYYILKYY